MTTQDKKGDHYAYVVVGKDEPFADPLVALVSAKHQFTVFVVKLLETVPFQAADVAVAVEHAVTPSDTVVEGRNLLFDVPQPGVPVLQHGGTFVLFPFQDVDAHVQLAHTLSDLLGGLRLAQVAGREGDGVEVLLETAVGEASQKSGTDPLASQPSEHAELVFTVDEMLEAVNAQEELWRRLLASRLLIEVFRGRYDIDGVGQGATETLHYDTVATLQGDPPPPLDLEGVRQAHDFILECRPGLFLVVCLAQVVGAFPTAAAVTECLGVVEDGVAGGHDDVVANVVGVGTRRPVKQAARVRFSVASRGAPAELGGHLRDRVDTHGGHAVLDNSL